MAQITISKEWLKEACQDVIDNALNEIKDEFISKSVIEDIRTDLISEYNNNADNWNYCAGIHKAIELIDNRISGKDRE